MSFRDRLKGIGTRIVVAFALENEEAVKEFVRSYMVARVEGLDAGHLAYAIENGSDLWAKIPPRFKDFGRQFVNNPKVKRVIDKYSAEIDSDLVQKWLKVDRPDMYSVILNWPGPQGRDWLRAQTEKVKAGLFTVEPILLARAPPSPRGGAPSQPRTSRGPPSSTGASQQADRRFVADTP